MMTNGDLEGWVFLSHPRLFFLPTINKKKICIFISLPEYAEMRQNMMTSYLSNNDITSFATWGCSFFPMGWRVVSEHTCMGRNAGKSDPVYKNISLPVHSQL